MTKEELIQKNIALVSLGCDKNRVDSEKMLYSLRNFGFTITSNVSDAHIIIINTCAFIESARKESIETIKEMIDCKTSKCEKIIVTGCFPSLNIQKLTSMLPEVDEFLTVNDEINLVEKICNLYELKLTSNACDFASSRILSTPNHYAYLKIADGCNNHCSYCTIPQIRGKYVSYPMESLIKEAEDLVRGGVKELILVAQDVTRYGEDLYHNYKIVELIKKLTNIEGLVWLRLHYCYPEFLSLDLINEIAKNPKVCKYLDIPLQHISNRILHSMNRASNRENVIALLKNIKSMIPNIALRTSIIVGYPTETETEFGELSMFVKDGYFEQIGFFPYSKEENTPAFSLTPQVNEVVKNIRLKKLVAIQTDVMEKQNRKKVGQTVKAICDAQIAENTYIFRTEWNSPEVDSVIIVDSKKLLIVGQLYDVELFGVNNKIDLKGLVL